MNMKELNEICASFVIILDGIIRGLLLLALLKYLYGI